MKLFTKTVPRNRSDAAKSMTTGGYVVPCRRHVSAPGQGRMRALVQDSMRTNFAEGSGFGRNGIDSFGGMAQDHLAASSDR